MRYLSAILRAVAIPKTAHFAVLTALFAAVLAASLAASPTQAQDRDENEIEPGIMRMTVTSSPAVPSYNNQYGYTETIAISATFTEFVVVDGDASAPSIGVQVGDNLRQATYQSGSGTNVLTFAYQVQLRDRDTDGISVPENEDAEGGDGNFQNRTSIRSLTSQKAPHSYYAGFSDQSDHKVYGRLHPWHLNTTVISDPGDDGIYTEGDVITVQVEYSVPIHLRHTDSYYTADIGGRNVEFNLDEHDDSRFVTGSYTVVEDDFDADGIQFNGGGGTRSGALSVPSNTNYTFPGPGTSTGVLADHKVVGKPHITGISITSTPAYGGAYRHGEEVTGEVTFTEAVNTGRGMYIVLKLDEDSYLIDGDDNYLMYLWYESGTGTDTIQVDGLVETVHDELAGETYYMQDSNGLSILGQADNDARLGEVQPTTVADGSAVSGFYLGSGDLVGHRVDSNARSSLGSLSITSQPSGGAYNVGDVIEAEARFDGEVFVYGSPTMRLRIGSRTVTATYQGLSDDKAALVFEYTVQAGDEDTDGVSFPGAALSIGDGDKITDKFDNEVNYGNNAMDNQPDHRVDAGQFRVVSFALTSDAGRDRTYAAGDVIEIGVTFNGNVVVTGTPQLTLEFADSDTSGTASYSETDGKVAKFTYTVASGDAGSDGIEIKANSLTLNGGTIQSESGTDAVLTHGIQYPTPFAIVDGIAPTFEGASVSSNGKTVTIDFTEDIKLHPLLAWFIGEHDLIASTHEFILSVLNVEVDGAWPEQTNAVINDETVTVTMKEAITSGEDVVVRYDGVYAADAPNILMDGVGNAMEQFGANAATNNSTVADRTNPHGIELSVREMTITEGDSASYTVKLKAEPSGDVRVGLTGLIDDNISVNPGFLQFTEDNWDTAQTVRVTTTEDDNDINFWFTIIHTASGSGYTGQDSLKILLAEEEE